MKLILIHHHLGSYHIARLNQLQKRGEALFVVELASKVSIRAWKPAEAIGFSCKTLHDGILSEASSTLLSRAILKQLEEIDPDCVVVAGYGHAAMRDAAKWAVRQGKKTILLSESQTLDRPRNPVKERLKAHWIKENISAVFASGARAAQYMESLGFPMARIWRGYSTVDNAYFSEQAGRVKLQQDKCRHDYQLPDRYFLYVGRFSEEKNLFALLEAYQAYREACAGAPWSLVMVGSGPQVRELKEHAMRLGLEGIVWPGFKQMDELPVYYALASAFVLPSLVEPWGLVVNEAMASGLPVIVSSRCGCVHDLVFPGLNGWVFDPHDTDGLAGLLKKVHDADLVEPGQLALGEASKAIVSQYTPETWAKVLTDCAETLCHRSHD